MEGGHDGAETGNLYATVEFMPLRPGRPSKTRAPDGVTIASGYGSYSASSQNGSDCPPPYSRSYRFVTRVSDRGHSTGSGSAPPMGMPTLHAGVEGAARDAEKG